MPGTKQALQLDDHTLGEMLFLAKNTAQIEELLQLAQVFPFSGNREEAVQQMSNKTKMPPDTVSRLLDTICMVTRMITQLHVDIPQFLQGVTETLTTSSGRTKDEDLSVWKAAAEPLGRLLAQVGPDHPFAVSQNTESMPQALSPANEEAWLAERTKYAFTVLRDCVEVSQQKHGGVPVLRGTRFPVSHLFTEMSEGLGIDQIAADFDLDKDQLKRLLMGLSIHLDRSFAK